jgi:type IV pilus assembly protein PilX
MTARRRSAEQGVVLLVTLILLIGLLVGAVALGRSVGTANRISGNLSFKTAALHSADLAVEAAVSELPAVAARTTPFPDNCAGAASPNGCRYYPTKLAVDAQGVPQNVAWTSLSAITDAQLPGYSARYVVERLCADATLARCLAESALGDDSRTPDPLPPAAPSKIFYRVTVKVDGPRSTQTFTQVVLSY